MINYVFHIGNRCQSLEFLRKNNFLSGFNCFSGTCVSFNSVINIIKNDFSDFENYIVKFTINNLKKEDDHIEFIRCYDFTQEKIELIKKLIKENSFYFFFHTNYYSSSNYCINLKYTDIDNFSINDLFFWKNNYLLLPNTDYSNLEQLSIYNKRKERFQNCLKMNKSETILLIYMDTLTLDTNINKKYDDINEIYTLPYNLFYIIPIYSEKTKDINNEKIFKIKNITFYSIYFENLDYQKNNNPNDDNSLFLYKEQYNKINEILLQLYEFNITKLF
jgi:hypothetical protein